MVYFFNEKSELIACSKLQQKEYASKMDLWNYAISICYNSSINETESILCSFNVKNHNQLLQLLYYKSLYFRKFTSFYSVQSPEMEILEYNLTRKGNIIFYNANLNQLENIDEFGLMYFPKCLSSYQKQYLKVYRDSLLEKQLYISQFSERSDGLRELTCERTKLFKKMLQ